jgi:hypothetical protein
VHNRKLGETKESFSSIEIFHGKVREVLERALATFHNLFLNLDW